MKKIRTLTFPSLQEYHTIAFYQTVRTLTVGECSFPHTLYVATEVNSGISRMKSDPVEALQSIARTLVAYDLIMGRCQARGIPFKVAPEKPADEIALILARKNGIVMRSVYYESDFYDQVDKDLEERNVYDRLVKRLEGVREDGTNAALEDAVQDRAAGPEALDRRRTRRKEGRRARSAR